MEDLYSLLGYMAPYFPFDAESIHNRDLKVGPVQSGWRMLCLNKHCIQSEQLLQDLSLAYCELTSLLVLPTSSEIADRKATLIKTNRSNVLAIQVERVAEYVTQALQGQVPIRFLLCIDFCIKRPAVSSLQRHSPWVGHSQLQRMCPFSQPFGRS